MIIIVVIIYPPFQQIPSNHLEQQVLMFFLTFFLSLLVPRPLPKGAQGLRSSRHPWCSQRSVLHSQIADRSKSTT